MSRNGLVITFIASSQCGFVMLMSFQWLDGI